MTISIAGIPHVDRLTLRPWRVEDAREALEVYGGHANVTRRPSQDVDRVHDLAAMRVLLQRWIAEDALLPAPCGRWAIERTGDHHVIGGATLLPLPPGDEDLGIGWHLTPEAMADGCADEAMSTLTALAFDHDVDEVFAVVGPEDTHTAATVRHHGMHWVGETTKYFGTELQVFRLRRADLDRSAPTAQRPPNTLYQSGAL